MRSTRTYKSLVKPILSANLSALLMTGFILMLVSLGYQVITRKIQGFGNQLTSIIVMILLAIVVQIFTFGGYKVANEAVTTGKTDSSYVTYGLQYFGEIGIFSVVYTICTAILTLFFIAPGVIYSYTYAIVPLVFAENPNITWREAMSISKDLMRGHRFELFVLKLSFILWNLASIPTFGLLNIYVVPYTMMTESYFYQDLLVQAS